MQFTPLTAGDFDQPGEPIEVGPFSVEIVLDEFPEYPYDAGTPPLIHTYSDGTGISHAAGFLEDFFGTVSPAWVSRHWRKLCEILDQDEDKHDADARDYFAPNSEGYRSHASLSDVREEMFREILDQMRPGSPVKWSDSATDWLDALAALYTLAGVPAFRMARNGYTQGQCIEILIVYTPDFCKSVGFNPKRSDPEKDASIIADTLAAWSFGDCYGYSIEDADGETLDSCFGFLGAWWSEAGEHLFYTMNEALEHHFKQHAMAGLAMTPEAMQTGQEAAHT